MEIDFSNLDDIEIDKEGITKKKLTKYIIIVPTFSILITFGVVIISFYYLIKGDYKKKKEEKEIIINCIEGDDDYCSLCKNDECVKCNHRYELVNGTCNPTFSFKVIYETTSYNESLELIKYYQGNILSLELDNEYIDIKEATKKDFTFTIEYPGNHTIYYSFDSINIYPNLVNIFSSEDKIIYIHYSKEFNTENITDMEGLFFEFKKLKYVDISNFDIGNVKRLDNMFYECSSLTNVKLPDSIANNLMSMSFMFFNCKSLTSIHFSKSMNYSTVKLINFQSMFSGCTSLESVNFSYLETINIQNTNGMFNNCTSLTSLDLSNFKGFNLSMDFMFYNCQNLSYLDISNLDKPISYNNCITNFPEKGKIKMSKNISEYIKDFLPKNWDIDIK